MVLTPQRGTKPSQLRLAPVSLSSSQQVRVERLHRRASYQSDPGILQVPVPKPHPDDIVAWVASVLRDVFTGRG